MTYIYGWHSVEAKLENAPHEVRVIYLQMDREDKRAQRIVELAQQYSISVQNIARKRLDALLHNSNHQGIAADVIMKSVLHENELVDLLDSLDKSPFLLLLDGVQDPHNLGACMRTAEAAGVNAIIVPKDNAVGLTDVVRKVASGAAETVPFFQVTNLARTMSMLKDRGIWLYGADSNAESDIFATDLGGAVGLVLGAEGKGLRRLTRETCDASVKIPMFGSVSSLNVSAAAAICMFEVVRQRASKN